jgi:predicted RNA binding protein YcfA (HicA-like mRNA interferase family)
LGKLPGVNHLEAVRALEKAGFRVLRQGKHIVMSDGVRRITIPRHNPVNAITKAGVVKAQASRSSNSANFSNPPS